MNRKLYGAVDLHSTNGVYDIADGDGLKVWHRRIPNVPSAVLTGLAPFKEDLVQFAIESTYNWYWLADALVAEGYPVVLANPSAMRQYEGLKSADDHSDAAFMTELLRLNILPTGWICPPEDRALRDLLRRRLLIVNSRTRQVLSIGSMLARQTGGRYGRHAIEQLGGEFGALLGDEQLSLVAEEQLKLVAAHTEAVKALEDRALRLCRNRPEYGLLMTVPGIGRILAMTILAEIGTIDRFEDAGKLSSYCRAVRADRKSNGKVKGGNNRRNGNRYLSWAFTEAVNHAVRAFAPARKWYQRKAAKSMPVVARKALCAKWAKAVWYILKEETPFDPTKVFG